MKNKVIPFALIFLMLLLPISSAASVSDLKTAVAQAADLTQKYNSGSLSYADYTVKLGAVQNSANAVLKSKSADESQIKTALGDSSSKTNWVPVASANEQVRLDQSVGQWDKIVFDSDTVQLKSQVNPVTSGNNKVDYEINFQPEFKAKSPLNDIRGAISDVQKLAKTYKLDPTNKEALNNLAQTSVVVENLYQSYAAESPDTCTKQMEDIFGPQNLVSNKKITTDKYNLFNANNIEVKASIDSCGDCTGWNFMTLQFSITDEGNPLRLIESNKISRDRFESLETNGFKQALIEANSVLQDVLDARNYQSAYDLMKTMEVINQVWDSKANTGVSEAQREENFDDRKTFFNSLFEGYSKSTLYSEQSIYEEILYRDLADGSEEMCTNQIDDNSNGDIDCQDNLCTGQICGEIIIPSTDENNLTTNTTKTLYCISGICQPKEEKSQEPVSVCGNFKCEQGETTTSCSSDCIACPVYDSQIDCTGTIVQGSKDENTGCYLPPVCVPKSSNTCTTSDDCSQKLCATSQCINGICRVTDIQECRQSKCQEAEKQTQICINAESIITSICTDGEWKSTGATCNVAVTKPEVITQPAKDNVCNVAKDCAQGYACNLGQCIPSVTSKTKTSPITTGSSSKKSSNSFSGITFTGDVVSITGDGIGEITASGISGVVPNTEGEVYGEVDTNNIPKRSYEGSTGSSPLTGIVNPTESEAENFAQLEQISQTSAVQNFRPINENEKALFRVDGICTKNNGVEKADISFNGAGEDFATAMALKSVYKEDGDPALSDWELKNLLERRQEFIDSFNEDFARNLFENELANNANNWEDLQKSVLALHQTNIDNWAQIGILMDKLGIKRLSEYPLVNFEYQSNLGKLKYAESIQSVRLSGSTSKVDIVAPKIEMEVTPPVDFVKSELKVASQNNLFPGSQVSSASRELGEGLTPSEKNLIKNNPKIMQEIKDLTENYPDGVADLQVIIMDNGEEIYNLYVIVNSNDIIKAEPMPSDRTPPIDAIIKINDFTKLYDLLSISRKNDYTQGSPWDSGFRFSDIFSLPIDWIKVRSKTSSFMNSVEVTGNNKDQIKSLFQEVFYILGSEENAGNTDKITNTVDNSVVWTQDGKKIALV